MTRSPGPSRAGALRRHPSRAAAALVAAVAVVALVVTFVAVAGRDGSSTRGLAAPAPTVTTAPGATVAAGSCIVNLHGKGRRGAAASTSGGVTRLNPDGNADAWGGREWRYFPDASYAAARAVVADAIRAAGCSRVVLDGFSNGGAFAAKLYCRGETFGGALVGVVVDDPVTDRAVEGCRPAPGTRVALYWTGALEGDARPGWSCAGADWTCEGGTTLGIAAYATALGTTALRSPNTDHAPHTAAPEPLAWLTGA